MSRRSKRELAPPPQPFPGSPSVHRLPLTQPRPSMPGCFPAPPASMETTLGYAALGPWRCGPAVPQQAMSSPAACSWWPAPSSGGGAAASSSQPDIDSDPKEWGMGSHPPGGFLSYFNHPRSQHLVDGKRGKGNPAVPTSMSHLPPQPMINLDDGEDDGNGARIDIRLKWTKPVEERLVVAWLNNSNDPINGNGKKTDRYWGDVEQFKRSNHAVNSQLPIPMHTN